MNQLNTPTAFGGELYCHWKFCRGKLRDGAFLPKRKNLPRQRRSSGGDEVSESTKVRLLPITDSNRESYTEEQVIACYKQSFWDRIVKIDSQRAKERKIKVGTLEEYSNTFLVLKDINFAAKLGKILF